MESGEERAWDIVAGLDIDDVVTRAEAVYDASAGLYVLKSFGGDIFVSPKGRDISGQSPVIGLLLGELGYYFRLSILWYLIGAQDIPPLGYLVKPHEMSGGLMYLGGTHVLPLDKIADRYGDDIPGFLKRGRELAGEPMDYGDASLKLPPFPRVPVVIVLWKGDEEFPARAELLFDATCAYHLPADIAWATATMSVLSML